MRVVAVRHSACGGETRVRLPGVLPAGVVRRVWCSSCSGYYSTERVDDVGVEPAPVAEITPQAVTDPAPATFSLPSLSLPAISLPRPSVPDWSLLDRLPSFDPDGRGWRLLSIPLAAVAVVAALLLIQGGGDDPQPAERAPVERAGTETAGAVHPPASGDPKGLSARVSENARLVRGSSYSLALPPGWKRIEPEAGATFAAISADRGADATLWIERDAQLDLPTFIARSLDQLEALAGSAQVIERVPAPTPEATIVRLAAIAPEGQPSYEVTLRAAGPYRYYLATSVQPDAGAEAIAGADLISGSFTPEAGTG